MNSEILIEAEGNDIVLQMRQEVWDEFKELWFGHNAKGEKEIDPDQNGWTKRLEIYQGLVLTDGKKQ